VSLDVLVAHRLLAPQLTLQNMSDVGFDHQLGKDRHRKQKDVELKPTKPGMASNPEAGKGVRCGEVDGRGSKLGPPT
jgi:hypothetical protein